MVLKVLGQFKRFFLLYAQKLSGRAKTFRVAMLPCYPGFSASGVGLAGHLRGLPTLNPSSSASTHSSLCTPLFSQKHKHSYFLFQTHVPARFPLHGSVYRRIHGGLKGSAQFAHLKSFPGCWSSKLHQILYFIFNKEEVK